MDVEFLRKKLIDRLAEIDLAELSLAQLHDYVWLIREVELSKITFGSCAVDLPGESNAREKSA